MIRRFSLIVCYLSFLHPAFSEETKPNIVYIMADDMGYADAGFNGGKEIKTPHLDCLAKEGAILSSFYVQPVCSPTRASLMTGRYVAHTGVYSVVRPGEPWGLPLAEKTLAQKLKESGYETAISGKWHLGEFQAPYRPTQRGFDHQYGLWFGMIDFFTHKRGNTLDWHRNDQPCEDKGYSTHLIAKEACARIRQRDPKKPLFLYLPFNAVHTPLQVPESYTAPYTALKGNRKTYAGMLAAMDEAIGQVVAALEEQKMRDNTLIVFSSDNGGPSPGRITDNGILREGKGTIYEGGVRVCAFATWPGKIPAGKVIDQPLHIIDWYPTLIRRAGVSLEQKLPIDGKDIWPVLTSDAKSPHEAILLSSTLPGLAAVRAGDWKLIHRRAPGKKKKKTPAGMPEFQLYHLSEDLGETKNLAESQPQKVAEMKLLLDKLLQNAAPSADPEPNASPTE
ncbi:MAG: arylsulfatase B [Akkermansiaceae bacterium]